MSVILSRCVSRAWIPVRRPTRQIITKTSLQSSSVILSPQSEDMATNRPIVIGLTGGIGTCCTDFFVWFHWYDSAKCNPIIIFEVFETINEAMYMVADAPCLARIPKMVRYNVDLIALDFDCLYHNISCFAIYMCSKAMGKSAVSSQFRRLGFPVHDSDVRKHFFTFVRSSLIHQTISHYSVVECVVYFRLPNRITPWSVQAAVHELYAPGGAAVNVVCRTFGDDIKDPDGGISRPWVDEEYRSWSPRV